MEVFSKTEKQFSSTEEELEYLRERVKEREKEIEKRGTTPDREGIIKEEVVEYQKAPETILHEDYRLNHTRIEGVVLDLPPESHDEVMAELLAIMEEKGIKNALDFASRMKNPHIEDDFHRFLVEYIKEGFSTYGLTEKDPVYKSLKYTLFEVNLPEASKDEGNKPLKEFVSKMDQFYSGLLNLRESVGMKSDPHFTIEIAVPNGTEEYSFYVAVPDKAVALFEKNVISVFPKAKIFERKEDYNIFSNDGVSLGSVGSFSNKEVFPIRTYEEFDHDPLNLILNAFSKIEKIGEGASVQFVIKPSGDYYNSKYNQALKQLKKGEKPSKALKIYHSAMDELLDEAKSIIFSGSSGKKKDENETPQIDQDLIEQVAKKTSSPIVATNIRIAVSAENRNRAGELLSHLESSFNQFQNTKGNSIKFKRLEGSGLNKMFSDFSFRKISKDPIIPLSLSELSTMVHFPGAPIESGARLRRAKSGTSPAPTGLPTKGTLLGVNKDRGEETKIFITDEDRLRHFYVIGQTGTGKTSLLKNMIIQDIKEGEGVCMIDPHGNAIEDILSNIPAERRDDVIYFDPGSVKYPMALNMLEYDDNYPEQKTFVVNELLSIFDKLFDMKVAGGPMFEQYFRNAVMLVMDDPSSGNTLFEVSRVLADKDFRALKLSRTRNPIILQFWRDVAEKAGGEASLQNIVPYITSKFDNFLSNDIMRPIIAQEKSSFRMRDVMDNKKILLVNLSKGRLGEINSNLIGLIIVGKILMAALSRVDSPNRRSLPPFYLYIDEFQNVTTSSIATILSEARKYKLSLTIAHQFIKQLDEKIKDAVFGNVGSIASFRVGAEDAEILEKQFEPVFSSNDLMNLDNHNAYVRLLAHGIPLRPFNLETIKPKEGNEHIIAELKDESSKKYGKPREEIEREIMSKYYK